MSDNQAKSLFDEPDRKPGQLGRNFEKSFDQPLAHRVDPLSSFRAGDKVLRSGRIKGQTKAVLEALKRHPNRTSAELARLALRGRLICVESKSCKQGRLW